MENLVNKVFDILENMNKKLLLALMLVLVVGITVGGFYFQKWLNYTFFYVDNVKTEIIPLEKNILDLQKNQNFVLKTLKEHNEIYKLIIDKQNKIIEVQNKLLAKP